MKFAIYGGFEIQRQPNWHGAFDKENRKLFWENVEANKPRLSEACGCYVFAIQNGGNFRAWYVGKTEKNTFSGECFEIQKKLIYNEILVDHAGQALLFLIPRLATSGKFSKPRQSGYHDVEFLETMLIGIALKTNPELANIRKTKLLKEMVVPGVINSPPGKPPLRVQDLKNALGLLHRS
jgi:hypothetical protein